MSALFRPRTPAGHGLARLGVTLLATPSRPVGPTLPAGHPARAGRDTDLLSVWNNERTRYVDLLIAADRVDP